MKEVEHWIYQRRQSKEPWAFRLIMRIDAQAANPMQFDITLYSDKIEGTGTRTVCDLAPRHLGDFSAIAWNMCRKEGIGFNENDALQFDGAILDLIAESY